MNNTKTFLFAGASSLMASETAVILRKKGHTVIGITRKPINSVYDQVLDIEEYAFGKFPAFTEALDGIAYFPGTITLKPFQRLGPQDFHNDYQINSLGAAAFIQAYLSNLKKATTASVVLISSVAAQTGLPFHASVSMAKAAIEGLTKALAAELAPSVRVNCVAPSLVDTPMSLKFIDTSEKMEQMKKRNPMRQVGTATDMGQAIAFLLLEESSWMTGQVLAVDGGMGVLKN